jgi:Protein of unknown function (DUF1501)
MNTINIQDALNRRTFLQRGALGLGATALGSLLNSETLGAALTSGAPKNGGMPGVPHFAPKAKRIIYLFQNGAPSQIDLFDPKPFLDQVHGTDLPESVRKGQRLTTMTSGQKAFPVARSLFKFQQHGQSGAWFSELIPHTAKIADELCVIRSMHTEAINHDPAVTFIQTGSQQAGRPCMGAWMAYGLGSENRDLPAFVVMTSRGSGRKNDQPLYDRLWSAGFLPSRYQGVRFRAGADPVLYLSNPAGFDAGARRDLLDDLARMNQLKFDTYGDPEISTRIAQYEMAFRMQTSVPDLTDLSKEPASTFELYGPDSRKPGTFAYNCLLARRLAERDVRFIQLYHMGWDQHENLPTQIRAQCADTDQPSAALVQDLKARGMLDDTLIIWGGEFGRTVYCQGKLTADNYGRDHHPRCFSIWMAGGGVKKGVTHGETDDFSYNIVRDAVHVHDLNATVQHLMGIDHTRLTYKYQGRHFRLTDVHGELVKPLLG